MKKEKTVAEQHAIIGNTVSHRAFARTTHPGAAWFYQPVQLGLFIHYGIPTVHGDLDISWGMMDNPERRAKGNGIATPQEYWALAEKFHPEHYHPQEWLSAARDAGFTYAVFTTRHHDGFAMWPSEASDFSTKQTMGARDLVGEYVAACRKVGLKVGLYYSPPDWRFNQAYMSFASGSYARLHPDHPYAGTRHEPLDHIPTPTPEHCARFVSYVNSQIRELLTRYESIDLLWFDGGVAVGSNAPQENRDVISIDEIRALQPQIVVNDRLWGVGDYRSQFECRLPDEDPGEPWETCHIWHVGGGWSYVKNADKYRDLAITLHQYEVCRKWGGNLLLNIAPRADGTVPDAYYKSVKEFGDAIKATYGEVSQNA